jgi:hypothetical protein
VSRVHFDADDPRPDVQTAECVIVLPINIDAKKIEVLADARRPQDRSDGVSAVIDERLDTSDLLIRPVGRLQGLKAARLGLDQNTPPAIKQKTSRVRKVDTVPSPKFAANSVCATDQGKNRSDYAVLTVLRKDVSCMSE